MTEREKWMENIDIEQLLQIIVNTAEEMWSSSLGFTPRNKMRQAWLEDFKVGDLVFEITSKIAHPINRVGWLRKIAFEPMEEWPEDKDPPLEKIYYIEKLNGETYRWENSRFVKLPFPDRPNLIQMSREIIQK